ncbi:MULTISPECIES: DUF1707 and DUF4190 domain-containing protein [Kitasatospora]|uniref:DUF4190 domain-containing protein n=1 Tax=Kitasatospora cystarginea TaxID=58350 RepID=A0ABN3DGY3_9ACTN
MAGEPWQMEQSADGPFAGQRPSPSGPPSRLSHGWQPAVPPVPAGYPDGPQAAHTAQAAMRAAHTDRERTVDVLKAAYAEGRLDAEEYGQRFEAANRAKTYGELSRLVADLPSGPFVAPAQVSGPAVPPTFLAPPNLVPPKPRANPLAVTSMVLGLLAIPTMGTTAVPAVVTGHVARAQLRRRGEQGDGMATVGLVLGWLVTAGWLAMILAVLVAAAGSSHPA